MPRIVKVVIYPDQRLKTASEMVTDFGSKTQDFLDTLGQAAKVFNGWGLAAVQIGCMQRIIFVDHDRIVEYENKRLNLDTPKLNRPLFMINPKIISKPEETFRSTEACISLPGVDAEVTRFKSITVEYHDHEGVVQTMQTDVPLLSACIQHEIDHINGITIAEHQSKLKQDIMIKKIAKYRKAHHRAYSADLDEDCSEGCGHTHH